MKNFHVPLPAELYGQLRDAARQYRRPATELAREAIAVWLEQRRRNALHRSLADYAARWAGTDADLDTDLEAVGVEHLLEGDDR